MSRRWLITLCAMFLLACDLSSLMGTPPKPTAMIVAPPSGTRVNLGTEVIIQSMTTDAQGIARVELSVNGNIVQSDPLPMPQTSYTLLQRWTPTTAGTHIVHVTVINRAGVISDPAAIYIEVVPGTASPTTSPATPRPPAAATTIPTVASASTVVPTVAPTSVITSSQNLSDLAVEIISIDATTIVRNQSPWMWLHYRVKNIGAGSTPTGLKIRLCSFSNNARNSGYMEVKELAPGESVESEFAVASGDYWPLGTQTIHLMVDYENAIAESNEANNLSGPVTVQIVTR